MVRDANRVPPPSEDEAGATCVLCGPRSREPHGRSVRPRGLRTVAAATAVVLLSGMTLLLSRDDAAVSVEALLAQAGRGLREAGLGVDDEAEGARPLAGAEGEAQGPDLAARSRRLTAEMEALDRAVRRRRDELDLVGASVARLRDAAEVDQENRRAAEAIKASADAGAAEARAGIEAVVREMAALRAQVAEQREALAAARMEADAARTALTALRAEIAEQAGRMEAARAEGEAGIRLVTDRLSELGRTARINREAIGRITGTIGSLQALSSRGLETARDPLVPERVSLVGGSEAARPLPDLKTRIAALKVALAETPDSGVGIAPEAPSWTEAALRPEQWRTIQNALARSGHYAGIPDGRPGAGTRAAIARYQRGLGSAATGRLSPAQIAGLLPLAPAREPMAER